MAGVAESVTERLRCSRPSDSLTPDYRRLFGDPKVGRWLRPPPLEPFTEAEIDRILNHDLRHWQLHDFGPWALTHRDSGEFVGRAGLAWTRVERRLVVELPWSVLPDFQRQGLATEAASAALGVAARIGLERVVSLTLVDNLASRRLMEKIGLEYERDVEHFDLPHALYGVDLQARSVPAAVSRPAGPPGS